MDSTQRLATEVRGRILRMVHKAKASHVASALSIVDILAVLYGQVMVKNPLDPQWSRRDRFILSKGHGCAAVYATLATVGYFPVEKLDSYGDDHSWLMNHISHHVTGVEFSTGSLGHGLPFAVGKALAAKKRGQEWRTFVVVSDGEMDEGSNWEGLLFAAHQQLQNLTVIIDYNKLQSLGTVDETLRLEPLVDKLTAFGCSPIEINGHDHGALAGALKVVDESRPTIVVAHTIKGKGVSFMENRVEWHYKNPNDEQLRQALAELGINDA
nr:transketolase [uncultured Rhodoferax sp.]